MAKGELDLQDEGKAWASAPALRSQVFRHLGIFHRPVLMVVVLTSVEMMVDPVGWGALPGQSLVEGPLLYPLV